MALEIYQAGLEGVIPSNFIPKVCRVGPRFLQIYALSTELSKYERFFVCGAGKASCGMAAEFVRLLGDRVSGGLVVTKYGHGLDLGPVRVLEAGHPVPDQNSLDAGEAMLSFAAECHEGDLVLFALSGGASSLMESLRPGFTLDEVALKNQQMLASGADIVEVNRQRKMWSRIKGGGLGLAFQPASVICAVFSDVIGDDLETIGSAPLYAKGMNIPNGVICNVETAIRHAVAKAKSLGLTVRAEKDWIFQGEARVEAAAWVSSFLASAEPGEAWIGGGETVVKVVGPGSGGRCQEFATAAAISLAGSKGVAVLAGSTDGTDGPTRFGGGLVDGQSLNVTSIDAREALDDNDSSAFLSSCDGLIETGPTQSNVNDLYLMVRT